MKLRDQIYGAAALALFGASQVHAANDAADVPGAHTLPAPAAAPADRAFISDCATPPCLAFSKELALSALPVSAEPFKPTVELSVDRGTAEEAVLPNGKRIRLQASHSSAAQDAEHEWRVLRTDLSVRRMLMRWARESGWQLIWDAQRDFPIEAEFSLNGSFVAATSLVMESLSTTDYPVQASLNDTLKIVRVSRYLQGAAR